MYRNFKSVDHCIFGRGSFDQLGSMLQNKCTHAGDYVVFLMDDIFEGKPLAARCPLRDQDVLIWVNVKEEPGTQETDRLVKQIKEGGQLPCAVVGIGGGSVMDYAKAISLMLTNEGKSEAYQGLDLIKNKGIHCVVVPTLSGTGAEVSMTAVLTGPEKKLGIKCDYTVPDQLILDPDLIREVPDPQRFYTAMDCYIHNVEALNGSMKNAFSEAYAEKSLALCRAVFLEGLDRETADEKLMIASYFGGLSLTYSMVGVCHALSYGLSYVMHLHHGIANCLVFNQLKDYYPEGVREFHRMLEKNKIVLPEGIVRNAKLSEEDMDKMVKTALDLDFMWEHALGKAWREHMTPERAKELYMRM